MQAGNDFENIKILSFNRNKKTAVSVNAPFNDTIARIRNGYIRRDLTHVYVINSKFIKSILQKLKDLKYIYDFQVENREIKVDLIIDKKRSIEGLYMKTYSSPGRRLSCSYNNIPRRLFGRQGHTLLSTNQGILTDQEAIKQKVGGVLLLEVYWCQR